MQKMIGIEDLKQIDDMPVVMDLTLAKALGFDQGRDVRKLIKRHRDELSRYGELRAMVARGQDCIGRSRSAEEFFLNEQQALLICMFARTDRAAEVRAEVIGVFTAWRRERQNPLQVLPARISAADDLDVGHEDEMDTKLRMLEVCRRIHGRKAAQRLWPQLGLPAVDGGFVRAGGDQSAQPFPEQVDRFLSECTVKNPGARVQSTDLYRAFASWCQSSGESVCSHKAFSMSMDMAGVQRLVSSNVYFVDIRLTANPVRLAAG